MRKTLLERIEIELPFIIKRIDENMTVFKETYPKAASKHNIYEEVPNACWTNGFWTGLLWLAYEMTQDDKYKEFALAQLPGYEKRLNERIVIDHHDMGFLFTPTAIAPFKLFGDTYAKELALRAADELIGRYHDKAGIIQAWGNLSDPSERGRMIIDCNMNLPLLYWATEVTDNPIYKDIAYTHARQASKYILRADDSTYHTYYMDPETGDPVRGATAQGYSDDSCWARGQAWAVLGFMLSYNYTQDKTFLETAKRTADYFLKYIPEDNVVYWDLFFTSGDEPRDTSSNAIVVCGLLELAAALGDEGTFYYDAAVKLMLALFDEPYLVYRMDGTNGILGHSVYNKRGNQGVEECSMWGDYFFVEAIRRFRGPWKSYW